MSRQTTKIEDLESQKSFQLFVNAIKTEGTRKYYVHDLYAFLHFTKITDFDSLVALSTDNIQDYLESYVLLLRKNGVTAIRPRISGPELFFEMNKKLFYKKILHKLFPSDDKPLAGGVAYTNEDILTMLASTKRVRTTAIIHFLACTGIRPGGIADPPIQKKHLVKMPEGCYAVKVYDESREGYWAFLTPEAVKAIDHYLESRKLNGETITEESYLFANYKSGNPKTAYLTTNGLTQLLKNVVRLSGVKRTRVNGKHYDKALSYGFRKRFNTILKLNNDVNSNIAEKLMAHKRGLDGRYLAPTIEECFTEFRKAIPQLTIDDSERKQALLDVALKEKSELEEKNEENKLVKNEVFRQGQIIENLTKQMNELKSTKKN